MSDREFPQQKLELLLTANHPQIFLAESHSTTMLKFLEETWKKELYCDLIVDVEGKKFKTHRFVLAMVSEYFRATFDYQNTLDEIEMKIDVTDAGTFEELLTFAYTGEIKIDPNNIEKVLVTSNFLGIKNIEEFCETYLMGNLTLDNCVELFIIADRYCLPNLAKQSRKKCCMNLKTLFNGEKFFSVPISVIEDLLGDNRLKVCKFGYDKTPMKKLDREELLYLLALKYISLNWCENGHSQNQKLINLLTLVKLPMLSIKFMLEGLRSMRNIKENADILSLINLSQTKVPTNNNSDGKTIYPESWKVPRLPANYSFELSKKFAGGNQVGRNYYMVYKNEHLDVYSCIRKVLLQTRLWDGREVIAGFRITYDNDTVSEFGLLERQW